jgi:hypothetical protein
MIRINDKWAIDVDAYNFTLQKKLNSTVKVKGVEQLDEDGKPIPQYQSIGYYNTLEKALEGLIHFYVRDALIDGGTMTVREAIQIVERSNDEVKALIKDVSKGN